MSGNRARHGPPQAIGTPLSGAPGKKKIDRPKRRHVALVVVGGLLAAWAAQKVPGYVSTVIAAGAILAAFVYWHHKDPRLAVTVGTWPVVAVAALAVAGTWKHQAKAVSKQADTASVAFGGGIWDTLDAGKTWLVAYVQANPRYAAIAAGVAAVVVVVVRKVREAR